MKRRKNTSTEITLEMKSFDKRVAQTNYHIELFFDEENKVDIKERMMRVVRQSIEDDSQKTNMLS